MNASRSQPAGYCRPEVLDLEPYEAGATEEEARRESSAAEIAKLASNENPYGPSPTALQAIVDETSLVHRYLWNRFTDLKEALAAHHGLDPNGVVLGHGSEAVMQLIPMVFVDRGDDVAIPAATYARYAGVSKVTGGRVIRTPMHHYAIDVAAIGESLTASTRLVWLCSPNNPTGTVVRHTDVRRLLEELPPRAVLVLDQAYQEYCDDPEAVDGARLLRDGCENLIVLRTFSKAYGLAGVRLGYGLTSRRIGALLDTVKEPFNLSRLAAVAGLRALADQVWLERCLEANRRERAWLEQTTAEMGLKPVPSQANFVLLRIGMPCEAAFRGLMEHGVLVRPGSPWGYDEHIRVTVGTPRQDRQFIAALAALPATGETGPGGGG